MPRRSSFAVAVALLVGTGCPGEPPSSPGEGESQIVALVDDEPIRAAELDEGIRLRLFDLEMARYRLRREELERRIAARTKAGEARDVEILLREPEPPRLDVRIDGEPVRGEPGAPVTIVEFLDFESPRCAGLAPILRRLVEESSGLVRLVARDLPLPRHERAKAAAEAAACAGAEGRYWELHDVLFQNQDDLSARALVDYARRVGLEQTAFEECLESRRFEKEVLADAVDARDLGISVVPTVFVNGLYVRAPWDAVVLRRHVDAELRRLGVEPPERREPPVALTLVGTVVEEDPADSRAAIRVGDAEEARWFRRGDSVAGDWRLEEIARDRVTLRSAADGATIELRLAAAGAAGPPPAPTPGRIDASLSLDREVVDEALGDLETLRKSLRPGRLDLEGRRLLKLEEVPPDSLYDRMGLRQGDLLLRVDGGWIHDADNPLWDSLRNRSRVRLLLFRQGFPKTFEYVIE